MSIIEKLKSEKQSFWSLFGLSLSIIGNNIGSFIIVLLPTIARAIVNNSKTPAAIIISLTIVLISVILAYTIIFMTRDLIVQNEINLVQSLKDSFSWKIMKMVLVLFAVMLLFGLFLFLLALLFKTMLPALTMILPVIIIAILWYGYRFSLIAQSYICNDYSTLEAAKESTELMKGNYLRVFGYLLSCGLIGVIAIFTPMFLLMYSGSLSLSLIGSMLTLLIAAIFTPIYMILLTLLYYDIKLKKDQAL